jgi:hypothetical protein
LPIQRDRYFQSLLVAFLERSMVYEKSGARAKTGRQRPAPAA